jgi:hypothetical protein
METVTLGNACLASPLRAELASGRGVTSVNLMAQAILAPAVHDPTVPRWAPQGLWSLRRGREGVPLPSLRAVAFGSRIRTLNCRYVKAIGEQTYGPALRRAHLAIAFRTYLTVTSRSYVRPIQRKKP